MSHLYLNYFDTAPLNPSYYSFGSRNADVQIINAHIESFDEQEQINLRCKSSSTMNKAVGTACDYKCHFACDGCTLPYSIYACKKCAFGAISLSETNRTNILCVERCPDGYQPDLKNNKLCVGE